MGNLSKPFDIPWKTGEDLSLALGAVKIYRGGAVGVVVGTGYAVVYNPATAFMKFVGVAEETVDNSAGSAGDKRIKVKRQGIFEFTQSGLAVTDIGAPAYLSDDNTVTTTPNAICVGVIVALDASSGKAYVDVNGAVSNPPLENEISVSIPLHASKVTYNLFVARDAWQVTKIDYTPDIAQGGALTATVVKATGTATPASATTPMHAAGAIDLNAAAHTVQPMTLTATVADLKLAAGERIGLVLSGAMTVGSGLVTVRMKRI